MSSEVMDWEKAMMDTQHAAKAASRGSERMTAALVEMRNEQEAIAAGLQKVGKAASASLEMLRTAEVNQIEQHTQTHALLNHLLSHASQSRRRRSFLYQGVPFIAGVVCGAFIVNLF